MNYRFLRALLPCLAIIAFAAQARSSSETKTAHRTFAAADLLNQNTGARFVLENATLQPMAGIETTFESDPIRSDFPINAAGAHWRVDLPAGSAVVVELRFSTDGKQWNQWLTIPPDEEPVAALTEDGQANPFAGDIVGALAYTRPAAKYVQYRIRFSGAAEGRPALHRFSLQLINSADGPQIQEILSKRPARETAVLKSTTSVAKPTLIKRSQWGAQSPRYAYTYTMVGHIAVHHTAGVSDYNVTDLDDCAARVRAIQSYHRNTLGWNDIGYAYAICRLGHIFQGREDDNDNNDVRGAHDAFNTASMGVANLGYFHPPYNHEPTEEMLDALHWLLAWKCDERGVDPEARSLYAAFGKVVDHIYGHREVRATACPGDGLFPMKGAIQQAVQEIISGVATSVDAPGNPGPREFALLRTWPNPFRPTASGGPAAKIQLRLDAPKTIAVKVYNMLGQEVREVYAGRRPAGVTELSWDGRDPSGRSVPPGIYFVRLASGEQVRIAKIMLLGK